jgi:hypothetical protein
MSTVESGKSDRPRAANRCQLDILVVHPRSLRMLDHCLPDDRDLVDDDAVEVVDFDRDRGGAIRTRRGAGRQESRDNNLIIAFCAGEGEVVPRSWTVVRDS